MKKIKIIMVSIGFVTMVVSLYFLDVNAQTVKTVPAAVTVASQPGWEHGVTPGITIYPPYKPSPINIAPTPAIKNYYVKIVDCHGKDFQIVDGKVINFTATAYGCFVLVERN